MPGCTCVGFGINITQQLVCWLTFLHFQQWGRKMFILEDVTLSQPTQVFIWETSLSTANKEKHIHVKYRHDVCTKLSLISFNMIVWLRNEGQVACGWWSDNSCRLYGLQVWMWLLLSVNTGHQMAGPQGSSSALGIGHVCVCVYFRLVLLLYGVSWKTDTYLA